MVNVNVDEEQKKRTSKGKQKIEIKKIEKKESKYVTFSKRHKGLFKKCNSFCSMYGSQFGAVTFSVAGKPMSAGNPSADAVIQRFLADFRNDPDASSSSATNWWETPIEKMSLGELEGFKVALQGLKSEVKSRIDDQSTSTQNDKILGVEAPELCQEKTEAIELSELSKGVTERGDNNDNVGVYVPELCQEKGERFDDYGDWKKDIVPEVYPELLLFNGGSFSMDMNIIGCC